MKTCFLLVFTFLLVSCTPTPTETEQSFFEALTGKEVATTNTTLAVSDDTAEYESASTDNFSNETDWVASDDNTVFLWIRVHPKTEEQIDCSHNYRHIKHWKDAPKGQNWTKDLKKECFFGEYSQLPPIYQASIHRRIDPVQAKYLHKARTEYHEKQQDIVLLIQAFHREIIGMFPELNYDAEYTLKNIQKTFLTAAQEGEKKSTNSNNISEDDNETNWHAYYITQTQERKKILRLRGYRKFQEVTLTHPKTGKQIDCSGFVGNVVNGEYEKKNGTYDPEKMGKPELKKECFVGKSDELPDAYRTSLDDTQMYLRFEYEKKVASYIDSGMSEKELQDTIHTMPDTFRSTLHAMFPYIEFTKYEYTKRQLLRDFNSKKREYQREKHEQETGNLQYVLDIHGNQTDRQQTIYSEYGHKYDTLLFEEVFLTHPKTGKKIDCSHYYAYLKNADQSPWYPDWEQELKQECFVGKISELPYVYQHELYGEISGEKSSASGDVIGIYYSKDLSEEEKDTKIRERAEQVIYRLEKYYPDIDFEGLVDTEEIYQELYNKWQEYIKEDKRKANKPVPKLTKVIRTHPKTGKKVDCSNSYMHMTIEELHEFYGELGWESPSWANELREECFFGKYDELPVIYQSALLTSLFFMQMGYEGEADTLYQDELSEEEKKQKVQEMIQEIRKHLSTTYPDVEFGDMFDEDEWYEFLLEASMSGRNR